VPPNYDNKIAHRGRLTAFRCAAYKGRTMAGQAKNSGKTAPTE
jgi:hypothetical protein